MKKILLTGSSGFIAGHTIPFLLQAGYAVHAVSRKIPKKFPKTKKLFWHNCDLFKTPERKKLINKIKPDSLLHFAWDTRPGKFWESIENLHWVRTSLDLATEFVECGGKRAVMAGSCAEYDWSFSRYSEQKTPLQPKSFYGICKKSLYKLLDPYFAKMGVSFAWGRIFFLFGPDEHPDRLVSSAIQSLLKKKLFDCSSGRQKYDFLYVKDVAGAFVKLLQSDVQGPVNIASGRPILLKDLINTIGEKLTGNRLIRFGKLTPPKTYPKVLFADTDRLTKEVGWSEQYTLSEGLDETIDWWRKNLPK